MADRYIDVLADDAAVIRRHQRVFDDLRSLFPMVRTHYHRVWAARRDGTLRAHILGDQRFTCLRDGHIPANAAEWELLAYACLEAAGRPAAAESELRRFDGVWIGIEATHPFIVARHKGCEWCAKGWKPCPTTSMPDAHVGPMH